jgi:hypothetical protein
VTYALLGGGLARKFLTAPIILEPRLFVPRITNLSVGNTPSLTR